MGVGSGALMLEQKEDWKKTQQDGDGTEKWGEMS